MRREKEKRFFGLLAIYSAFMHYIFENRFKRLLSRYFLCALISTHYHGVIASERLKTGKF